MIEVLKLALKALNAGEHAHLIMNTDGIKDKVRQAIAELESQEPVAWRYGALLYHDKLDAMEFIRTSGDSYLLEPLYAHPPQRTWVGLTVDEILSALEAVDPETKRLPKGLADFAYAIQAKLKEKNI